MQTILISYLAKLDSFVKQTIVCDEKHGKRDLREIKRTQSSPPFSQNASQNRSSLPPAHELHRLQFQGSEIISCCNRAHRSRSHYFHCRMPFQKSTGAMVVGAKKNWPVSLSVCPSVRPPVRESFRMISSCPRPSSSPASVRRPVAVRTWLEMPTSRSLVCSFPLPAPTVAHGCLTRLALVLAGLDQKFYA